VRRGCFVFELVPGREAEYERRHESVWPEIVAGLKGAGFSNYTVFRRGSTIIAYGEFADGIEAAFGALDGNEDFGRWSASFDGVIAAFAGDDGALATADEVWHLE
jgi:L-rhamnose mutarotase